MSRMRANVIANFGGQVWGAVLGILLVPFYLKYLGIEAYGLVGFFASLQAIISVLDMGLSTTANRDLARSSVSPDMLSDARILVRTLEVVYYWVGILISLFFFVLSGLMAEKWVIAEHLSPETIRLAVIILGITVATRWPVSLYSGVMRGMEKQVLLNAMTAGIATLRGIGAVIALAFISRSVITFLVWNLLSAVLELSLMAVISHRILPPSSEPARFSTARLRTVWRFSAGVGAISLFAIVLKQLDKVLISTLLPMEQLGYYTTASVAVSGLYWVVTPVAQAVFPRFSALIHEDDTAALAGIYHKSAQVTSFVVAPFAGMLIFFPYEILFAWTRSDAVASHTGLVLSLLALASLFNAMMQLPYMLQLAAGLTRIPLWNNGIAVVLLAPLIYFSVNKYGIAGGAGSWVLFNIFYYFLNPHVTHRYILRDHLKEWIMKDTLPFIVSSLVIFWGMHEISGYADNRLTSYLLMPAGLLLYLLVILLVHRPLQSSIKDMLRMRQDAAGGASCG